MPATTLPRQRLLERLGALESWTISLYRGCDFHCAYCITGVQGTSVPRFPARWVRRRLREELEDVPRDVRITTGGLIDAYPRAEAREGVTREALLELLDQGREFGIVTKGATVLRDIDLFQADPRTQVTISLCAHDDALLRKVDPAAPPVAERLEMVRALDEAGVRVGVGAAPWIPGITDANALIELIPEHIDIRIGPLRVAGPHVRGTPFGRRYDQAEINAAYLAARDATPERPNVFWSQPSNLDGAPMHLRVLLGRRGRAAPSTPAAGYTTLWFVDVRGAGGTHVRRALWTLYPRSRRYPSEHADVDTARGASDVRRLLELPALRRRDARCYVGHFPLAASRCLDIPGRVVTAMVLRDPVERAIALLRHRRATDPAAAGCTLDELYDDERFRQRLLVEHQARLLAMTPEQVRRQAGSNHPTHLPDDPLGDDDRSRALEALEGLDVVGTAADLPRFTEQVGARLGVAVDAVPNDVDVTPGSGRDVSVALRRRIRADNPLDTELVARATELAGAGSR